MKKLNHLSLPLLVWLCSWVMVAQAQVAVSKCETNFKYSFQNNFCPPTALCLVADHVNYTFATQQNADYYSWNFGDGSSAIDSIGKIAHSYFKPGKYKVSLIAYYNAKTQNPCKATYLEIIEVKFPYDTILPSPCAADLQTSTSSLSMKAWDAKQSITTDAMTQTLYFWNYGDGSKSVGSNSESGTAHDYKKGGKYLLKMTKLILTAYKSSESCTGSITVDSIIFKVPCYQKEICRETHSKWIVVETENTTSCTLGLINSVDNFTLTTYDASMRPTIYDPNTKSIFHWDFGDGKTNSTNTAEVKYTYQKAGKYLVTMNMATLRDDSKIDPTKATCSAAYADSLLHMSIPCFYTVVCRNKYSFWVTIGTADTTYNNNCQRKAIVTVSGNTISYIDNAGKIAPINTVKYNYWSFGDGTDTVALSGVHTYKKAGKYLVKLHSAQYNNVQMLVYCNSISYDSILHTWIPCYHRLNCRSVDSVWVEVGKENPINTCLEITSIGKEITVDMALAYTADFKPGVFHHRYYNFGDGSDTMGVNQATHTYKKDGTYLVTGTEVTYYAGALEREQLYPDSVIYQCKAIIADPSVRFVSPYCPTKELSRIVCSEWITINNNKLVTSISPNPANEFANLYLENAVNNVDFMIYNAAGMLVKKIENIANGTQQFDTTDMATGLYLYTISKDGNILKRDKFAVNR